MEETHLTTVDVVVSDWLDAKFYKSASQKTLEAYSETIIQFREGLHQQGLDLDSDSGKIMLQAQAYAGSSATGRQVKATTYNQRLSILSSFYIYAKKRGLVATNPIEGLKRPLVQKYAGVKPLSQDEASARLASIDRSTLQGKRDYALLAMLLEIGWRASEVARLSWGNVQLQGIRIVLMRERAKGGKVIATTLSIRITRCLLQWLHAYYGSDLEGLAPDAPLWVALAPGGRNGKNRGQRLRYQAISDICKKYLDVGRVHITRDTGTVLWEQAGMPVSEIRHRLNHKKLHTTSTYLQQLHRAKDNYADEIAGLLGIE